MPEYTVEYDNLYLEFLDKTYDVLMEICASALRLYVGFSITNEYINCNSFISWCFEISFIDYFLNRFLSYFFELINPEVVNSDLIKHVFPKMVSLWLVSLLLHQSLLVLLFSQAVYWLFASYSKLFSRLLVESLSLFYYYQSIWLIAPILINLGLSLLYCIDLFYETDFLAKISHISFFEMFLKEWGLAVIPYHSRQKNRSERCAQITKMPGLSDEDNFHYHVLKQRYLTSTTPAFIQHHLQEFRSFLATEYYQHQASYVDNKQNVHVLPLEWNDFVKYRQRVFGHERVSMLKTYYQNQYHSAWRMISNEHDWGGNDQRTISLRHQLLEPQQLEFIVTLWLALKKKNEYQNFDVKAQLLIKVLHHFNRYGNFYMHRGRIEYDRDDMFSDKPGEIEVLYQHLLPIIAEKNSYEKLTTRSLRQLLVSFSDSIIKENFISLTPVQQHEMIDILQKIQIGETSFDEYAHLFEPFNLSGQDKDYFLLKLNTLFGRRWIDVPEYISMIEYYFSSYTLQPNHLYEMFSNISNDTEFKHQMRLRY